ncbi:MAG: hypothetical protein GY797_11010 [Deltaproteobacteria bacterium]|nr:hypothetical protein [Deltaproteobacteria bacterium]
MLAKAIVVFVVFLMADVSSANDVPRLSITILKYGGASEETLERLEEMLYSKIGTRIFRDALRENDPNFDYLKRLKITRTKESQLKTSEDYSEFWDVSKSLELLHGAEFPDGDTSIILSTIYLGSLKGSLPNTSIQLQIKITPNEYYHFKDSHSLATVYALAMDAIRLNKPPNVISFFLNKALFIAQNMPEEEPGIFPLKKAVLAELEKLESTPGR